MNSKYISHNIIILCLHKRTIRTCRAYHTFTNLYLFIYIYINFNTQIHFIAIHIVLNHQENIKNIDQVSHNESYEN
jgi:glycerol-3-phosphate acyltransferase PlsY